MVIRKVIGRIVSTWHVWVHIGCQGAKYMPLFRKVRNCTLAPRVFAQCGTIFPRRLTDCGRSPPRCGPMPQRRPTRASAASSRVPPPNWRKPPSTWKAAHARRRRGGCPDIAETLSRNRTQKRAHRKMRCPDSLSVKLEQFHLIAEFGLAQAGVQSARYVLFYCGRSRGQSEKPISRNFLSIEAFRYCVDRIVHKLLRRIKICWINGMTNAEQLNCI